MKAATRESKQRIDHSFSMKCYFREISQFPLLDRDDEIDLAERIQGGDLEAREQLINANLRLVAKIANDYSMYGLDVEDLICEGNIGLIDAAERFDPSYGVRFSTYSSWWIKRRIKGALGNQSRTIRLPLHVLQKLRDIERAELEAITNKDASPDAGVPAAKIAALRRASQPVASLDDHRSEDGVDNLHLGAVIQDEGVPNPSDAAVESETHRNLIRLLPILRAREQEVIIARFGLGGCEPETLEQIGQRYGISRERVRQIQNSALKILRGELKRLERPVPRSKREQRSTQIRRSKPIPQLIPFPEAVPA